MLDHNLRYAAFRSIWFALDLIYPPECIGCGTAGSRWCSACQEKVRLINGSVCDVCGVPQSAVGLCGFCRADRPHFRALRAWSTFDGPVREALHKMKYQGALAAGDALAAHMLKFVRELDWPFEVIVPIPLGHRRKTARGYNQVMLIARPLALGLRVELAPSALRRQRETSTQVGLGRAQRRENMLGAFIADRNLRGRTVLLVDDVATTGATLSSAAAALCAAGARDVFAFTAARALRLDRA